jgi:hypothetical protein
MKVICGRPAITVYWVKRFAERPAGALLELQLQGDAIVIASLQGDAIVIAYRVPEGLVQATLYFGSDGKIAWSVCGPVEEIVAGA